MRTPIVLAATLFTTAALACSPTDPLVKDASYCGVDAAQKGQYIRVIPRTNNNTTQEGVMKASTNG